MEKYFLILRIVIKNMKNRGEALLTAGGSGTRMASEIPKQFLTVDDKPIIVYTMEAFQRHPAIDKIIIACKEGWEDILSSYAKQFKITKLESIVKGGRTGHESVRNMLEEVKKIGKNEDIVLVHDGNRPMVSADIISDSISVCQKKEMQ